MRLQFVLLGLAIQMTEVFSIPSKGAQEVTSRFAPLLVVLLTSRDANRKFRLQVHSDR